MLLLQVTDDRRRDQQRQGQGRGSSRMAGAWGTRLGQCVSHGEWHRVDPERLGDRVAAGEGKVGLLKRGSCPQPVLAGTQQSQAGAGSPFPARGGP